MSTPLNIAVVGLGRMGRIYSRALATQVDAARLHAVADLDLGTKADFLKALDVPNVLRDAEEAVTLPDVQAVVIATPTSTHRDLVMAAAAAGKAIFCEKPLALTLQATREMLAIVEQSGVPLQVGFMRRFDPAYRKAKARIDRGETGEPVTFKAIGRDPFCPEPEYADPTHSGGLIMDMGIHDFDLARWLMDSEVQRVTAEGTLMVCNELRAVGDIDNAIINLRFASGAIGNVEISRNAFYGYDVRTEVLGSKTAVRIGNEPAAHPRPERDGAQEETYLLHRFGEAYRAQMRHFVDCLRQGEQPDVTGVDALAAFEIGLAATHAARTNQPVNLEDLRSGRWPGSPNERIWTSEVSKTSEAYASSA